MRQPYLFDEFFASGKEETISPFLIPDTRKWGQNLPLKSALLAAALLFISFLFLFINKDVSNLSLVSVFFLVGTPALLNTIEDLRNVEINIDVLMTLAAFLSVLIGSGLEGALLLVLFEFSGAMENMVTKKTKTALISLKRLSPQIATVIESDGTLVQRSVREIPIHTSILIKAGEVIPLDGLVTAGSSFVNLVHLTGESQPIAKHPGNTVQAGAYNLDGTLTIKITRTSADSTLSKIITLILKAQEAKPKLERFFDRFGKWYSMSIIVLSICFAAFFPYLFSIPFFGKEGSIYRALAFLIAASPCALIIAIPTAYLSAISSCARRGILLKGSAIFDALSRCALIAFDKTGTLTTGNLICSGIDPLHNPIFDEKTIKSVAAGLEKHAVHPIATAILALSKDPAEIAHFQNIPGYGLQGEVTLKGKTYHTRIGHPDFIAEKFPKGMENHRKWQAQNTFLLIDDALYVFHFTDEIRKESKQAISALASKLSPILLTGDHTENAQVVAKELNISSVHANLRPEDKLQKIAELSKTKGLIMVGDGINDAPALARATVGISMGEIGSATATAASDVIFLKDNLLHLPFLMNKSKKTMNIVRENMILALTVIFFATTPALLGYIPLWLAVILHEGGTVIVGLNSLRLLK